MIEPSPRRLTTLLAILCTLLGGEHVGAQAPAKLIADINKEVGPQNAFGSFSNEFTRVGSQILFTAISSGRGTRIWKTDGTTSGTVPVFGLNGTELFSAQLSYAATVGNVRFFRGQTRGSGTELWRTDGTAAGTFMAKDIVPGTGTSNPQQFAALGNIVIFQATTPAHGTELWRSDGTTTGTMLLKDIRTGTLPSSPYSPVVLGNKAIFRAGTDAEGSELWVTDGTSSGTVLLKDLYPGKQSGVPSSIAVNGKIALFTANGTTGYELWRTDGTASGTVLLKDIRPGPDHSYPYFTVASGSNFFFAANDGKHGVELWRSDGTAIGTVLVRDLATGTAGSDPRDLTAYRGGVLFTADLGSGMEIFFSDGTATGTVRLASGAVDRPKFHVVSGTPDFAVFRLDGALGREMWRTEGTPATTRIVKDIHPGSSDAIPQRNNVLFGVLGKKVVFCANDGKIGEEVWESDGTASGTKVLKDIDIQPSGSKPLPFGEIDGKLLFTADDGKTGRELWTSDGTTAGTQFLIELRPGKYGGIQSFPVRLGGALYFFAAPGNVTELWKTDGTRAGTTRVAAAPASSVFFPSFVRAGNRLYFGRGADLWTSDGTGAGTKVIRKFTVSSAGTSPSGLTEFLGKLWFVSEDLGVTSMWQSDGTTAGTKRFSVPGTGQSEFAVAGKRMYFRNTVGQTGTELWSTDGTVTGTALVKDIVPGASSGFPKQLTAAGSKLFFVAGYLDRELWVSDGTATGTFQLKNIHPTFASNPELLTPFGNRLLFHAESPVDGREPWISDGTSAGTYLLRDVFPGTGSSLTKNGGPLSVGGFTLVGSGRLALFQANDGGNTGGEVWGTDGTVAGTRLIADVLPGSAFSFPNGFAVGGTTVLFSAQDQAHGVELFGIDLVDLKDSLAKPIGSGCPGGSGRIPQLGSVGLPKLGNLNFAMTVRDAATNAPALLSIGARVNRFVFNPVCATLNATPLVFLPFQTSGTGTAVIGIPIPNSNSLRGAPAVTEAAVLDAGGKFLNIGSLSNALLTLAGD